MCEKYRYFYEMVKNWTLNDYCTPNIKAEVIIDMLISEFVEEIVQVGLQLDNKPVLLAKEFPIKVNAKNDNTASKIDYLLYGKDKNGNDDVYIVELKTDNDSFNNDQYDKYIDIISDENYTHLGDSLYNIVEDAINNEWENKYMKDSNYVMQSTEKNKNDAKHKQLLIINSTRKYIRTLKQIQKVFADLYGNDGVCDIVNKICNVDSTYTEIADNFKEFINGKNKILVYLSLTDIPNFQEEPKVKNISISKINENIKISSEKIDCWNQVYEILKEIIKDELFLKNLWSVDTKTNFSKNHSDN